MKYKVTLGTHNDVPEIAALCRYKYSLCKDWPEHLLRGWLDWYVELRLCVIVREIIELHDRKLFGNITTLLLGRPVSDVEKVRNEMYYVSYSGDTFFIDLAIVDDSRLIPNLTTMMERVVGPKDYLAFTRDHGTMNRIRKYPLTKLLRFYATKTL